MRYAGGNNGAHATCDATVSAWMRGVDESRGNLDPRQEEDGISDSYAADGFAGTCVSVVTLKYNDSKPVMRTGSA